ncbi:MAG: caspase family protein [Nitrososphaerales archaeon]
MSTPNRIVMLSIGIGNYQNPRINPLSLTRDDAKAMSQVFRGVGPTDPVVKLLLDQDATKAGIKAGIDWLAETAGPDDIAIWYYSGHGARYADPNSDEPNAYDEFLCPYDTFVQKQDISTMLRDKEIKEWIKGITAKTKSLVAIFDSCHSGDAVQLGEATPKEIERSLVEEMLEGITLGAEPAGMVSTKGPLEGHMLLAAAQPHQRSYEIRGMHNGLFTTYVLQAMQDSGITTFYSLFKVAAEGVNRDAARYRLQQTPQLMQRAQGDLAFR